MEMKFERMILGRFTDYGRICKRSAVMGRIGPCVSIWFCGENRRDHFYKLTGRPPTKSVKQVMV
jgi:hypothetical protein